MVQDGSRWFKMVQDGSRWFKMVQDGSRWFRMVELLRWFGMVELLWKLLSMFKHASTLTMLREATTARLAPTTGSRVGRPTRRTGGDH